MAAKSAEKAKDEVADAASTADEPEKVTDTVGEVVHGAVTEAGDIFHGEQPAESAEPVEQATEQPDGQLDGQPDERPDGQPDGLLGKAEQPAGSAGEPAGSSTQSDEQPTEQSTEAATADDAAPVSTEPRIVTSTRRRGARRAAGPPKPVEGA